MHYANCFNQITKRTRQHNSEFPRIPITALINGRISAVLQRILIFNGAFGGSKNESHTRNRRAIIYLLPRLRNRLSLRAPRTISQRNPASQPAWRANAQFLFFVWPFHVVNESKERGTKAFPPESGARWRRPFVRRRHFCRWNKELVGLAVGRDGPCAPSTAPAAHTQLILRLSAAAALKPIKEEFPPRVCGCIQYVFQWE